MRRFAIKLSLVAVIMTSIIVAMHVFVVVRQQQEVDRVYTLEPCQDILVLSSSELGCAIVQAPKYHNKTLWVSDTSATSQLMRLRELERRGQLANVKMLMVPFNYTILMAQNAMTDKWALYQELSVSWRYLDLLPCSKMEFLAYIASNLRWPFHVHISDSPPVRGSLAERPKDWRDSFFRTQCSKPTDDFSKSLPEGWEARLLRIYEEMFSICQRHNIRMIVVQCPLLPQFDACQLPSTFALRDEWVRKLRQLGAEYCVPECSLDEHDFFDTRHLVPASSIKFTDALYRVLSLPIGETSACFCDGVGPHRDP